MALMDAFGREIKKGRPILDEIGVTGVRDRYSTYPSQGLTPERLAAIFKEADTGDVSRQSELFEEMEEKDTQLGALLQTRKLAVAGLEWEVSPASEDKEDEKIAAFIREALAWMDNFDELLLDLLDAVGRGFSVSEIIWEISEGKVWPKEAKWRHQKHFTFYEKDLSRGVCEDPRLLTDAERVYGEELPPYKFIVHKYRARSGSVPRGGILRPCAWIYLFKNYTLKDWVIFNERYAMPLRVGKYAPGASEEERDILKKAVMYLGSDAAAVISESTQIDFPESQKYGSIAAYEKFVAFANAALSKAVLGHSASADSTPGKLGSEKEAREVRQDLLEADAKALSKTIRMQLVLPLVVFNFGPDKNLPGFKFKHEEGEDLESLATTYKTIAEIVDIPTAHVYERFGIPAPEKDEETTKRPAPATPFKRKALGDKLLVMNSKLAGGDGDPETVRLVLSSIEQDDEWVSRYLERISPSLGDIRDKALGEIEAYLKAQGAPPPFEEFDAAVQNILGKAYSKVDRIAISDAVTEMYKWYKLTDLLAPDIEAAFGGADVRTVDFLTRLDEFYHSKFVTNPQAKNAITEFLRERYLEGGEGLFGRGDPAAVQELRDLLSQKLIDLSEGQVNRIVETSVQRARNWAHVAQVYDAGITEIEIFEPTQDCSFCAAMHGKVIKVDAAHGRMAALSAMDTEEYEAELKANPPVAMPDNIDAFVARGELPPYHPHCHGRFIKRVR